MKKLKNDYKNKVKDYHPKPNYMMNCVKAFLVGGVICTVGEVLMKMYIHYFHLSEQNAGNITIVILVLLSSILTGFGIYDKIGQFSGAGSLVPVTGFANSMVSAAMEHRSEGVVLGIATNMFRLAGSVIVFGVVGAYIVGLIRYSLKVWIS
ncbi:MULTISPECIES: stage V sporulation protein AC [Bacillus cereus group]|uniref:stage V sporulation protein AC n=1 Tax=Bacillus cereus group TaxID=86661 RepID=UPI00065FD17A|nr:MULTISPECIES: stage V sporulation protein AC [Bacillus cereus group]AWC33660.1 stage V sporulation protein AC [Bacillus cytotoxicus]AWC37638.1 stage V sporulation protein AC [Bacillus cytotoxicus]AWC61859.1 stage V sporulation protein AC [Bacillus cytotoxicus]KMT51465.1 stage V sporulation protein AC [Bacillus cytotoxicus]MDH2878800.1 stage V sporulation protein AC [Bacillus cytotoxicus]